MLMMSSMVKIRDKKNNFIQARVLLDTCATANFITTKFAKKLDIESRPCKVRIGAVNNLNTTSREIINLTIFSNNSNFSKQIDCYVIPNISDAEPSESLPREYFKISKTISLADPDFHIPRSVDILLGAGPTVAILQTGRIKLNSDASDLFLQKTKLGWVVVGEVKIENRANHVTCKLTNLNQLIERFWQVEEISNGAIKATDESRCEKHFLETTTRQTSGRYVVRLPFRHDPIELGDSRSQALRRFYALQNRLNKQPNFKVEYSKVLQNYIDLGHMSLMEDESPDGYYIPHQAVIKNNSSTTKVRVVFDASAKTTNGLSLNDVLMVGPTIQDKLFTHLVRFRSHVYVLIADIEQMYRQVLIHPDDRKYQKIFWYHAGAIKTYQLNTVTFGIASSPFLAIRSVNQLAEDEKMNFPLASKILKRDMYVDNLLSGANCLEEILKIRDELILLCQRGGFTIRQWASNHTHALDNIHEKIFNTDNIIESKDVINTLGMSWSSPNDSFIYTSHNIDCKITFTKRNILSQIAKIFDPLGLLGPVIFSAKVIMQECWALKGSNNKSIGWDVPVTTKLNAKWSAFLHQLREINKVVIPRYCLIQESKSVEIHGFCDASVKGYGACIYLRSVNSRKEIFTQLVCSKSRVAPMKNKEKSTDNMTIPRLELCAALLLTRLYNESIAALELNFERKIFWSDSTIVLQWLKKSPQLFQVFEANRIREIQSADNTIEWRHVRTHDNPADALSRGQYPIEFTQNLLWYSGPRWLSKSEQHWPTHVYHTIKPKETQLKTCLVSKRLNSNIFERFSSYTKLINVLTYCYRWGLSNKNKDCLIQVSERIETEIKILRIIQHEQFGESIKSLKEGKLLKSSNLSALTPFLDEKGILRVGGRLINTHLTRDQKHPILLPSKHHVTDLIIRETHLRSHHAGIQSTLFTLRQKFWLIDGKNQVRKIVRKCISCIKNRPQPMQYQMANLPGARVQEAHAFSQTGIDFFGPLYIKEKKFRNRVKVKSYGCVFVCMATKAVHIEVTSDLTTEGFLAAFRRFSARRAIPVEVYSDNGTNFVGARNELRELYVLFNSAEFKERVNSYAIQKHINWHFNPPASPHFGGLWEAAVKSFKHHLKRVVGVKILTFEEINTLLVEIEAILNSRPLWCISTDPNDPIALTPAHVLVGKPLTALPQKNLLDVPENRLNHWQFISRARDDFWRRWHLEYLHELQKRVKWRSNKSHVTENTVVVLIDKDQPCMQWELGLIVRIYPGTDKIVRVVDVKTKRGIFKRNLTTLCALPTEA